MNILDILFAKKEKKEKKHGSDTSKSGRDENLPQIHDFSWI